MRGSGVYRRCDFQDSETPKSDRVKKRKIPSIKSAPSPRHSLAPLLVKRVSTFASSLDAATVPFLLLVAIIGSDFCRKLATIAIERRCQVFLMSHRALTLLATLGRAI